jgi:septal ring factor EnvC (AmiA/AmiB activator)
MLGKGLVSGLKISAVVVATAFFVSACTSKVTEEQLKKLESLKQQQSELNTKIKNKKSEISDLEKELAAHQAKLKKCQSETEFVNEKLAKWPNCWPDWSPAPPPAPEPAPEPVKKGKGKK